MPEDAPVRLQSGVSLPPAAKSVGDEEARAPHAANGVGGRPQLAASSAGGEALAPQLAPSGLGDEETRAQLAAKSVGDEEALAPPFTASGLGDRPIMDLHRQPATPALFAGNPRGERRFWEFFTANIRNPNTRVAYLRAAIRFSDWCGAHRMALHQAEPIRIAAYIEQLQRELAAPSVKQHLAALRMLFDWMVIGQALPYNPATSVRGPKFVVRRGKTPVLGSDEARDLLDSVPTNSVVGLRDRALIGVMVYTFARVGAVVGMRLEDYFQNGKRRWFRLHEKGGKRHEVPAHHHAEAYVDAYLEAAGIHEDGKSPLFRSADGRGQLKTRHLRTGDVLRMIKRRTRAAGLPASTCCHTFRATGITAFLENGGTLEQAQAIAAHESPRTTKLYDRTGDALTPEMIEKIGI